MATVNLNHPAKSKMFTVSLLLLLFVIAVIYLYVKRQYSFWANRGVPFQKPVFPFGNVKFFGRECNISVQMAKIYAEYRSERPPPFVGLYFFVWPVILATSMDFVRNVCVADFQHFQERGRYYNERDDPISANLFNLVYGRWKILRTKLTPVFTVAKLKSMYPTMLNIVNESMMQMNNALQVRDEIDISDFVARIQIDIFGACTFGIEFNCSKNPNSEFIYYSEKVVNPKFSEEISSVLTMNFKRLAKLLRIRSIRKDVSDFFADLVRDTVRYREKNDVQRDDMIGHLIKLKNAGYKDEKTNEIVYMSLDEIVAQAFALYMGGTKTISSTMAFMLFELAQPANKHIQDKARDEINTVLQKFNGELTYEALHEMSYVDAIINGKHNSE